MTTLAGGCQEAIRVGPPTGAGPADPPGRSWTPPATLFVDPGYAATPLTAIAAEAGVASRPSTRSSAARRRCCPRSSTSPWPATTNPWRWPQRQFVADIRALTDARAKLARYAAHLAETHARQAQVMLALAGAATADPDAAAIWRKNLDDRRQGMTMFAADLAATGELRPDHTVETAADVLWLAMDVRNYDWLVRERGWPPNGSNAGTSTPSRPRSSPHREHHRRSPHLDHTQQRPFLAGCVTHVPRLFCHERHEPRQFGCSIGCSMSRHGTCLTLASHQMLDMITFRLLDHVLFAGSTRSGSRDWHWWECRSWSSGIRPS